MASSWRKASSTRRRRWTSAMTVTRWNCFVEAALQQHRHARELPRGRGHVQQLTRRRHRVTTSRLASHATSSCLFPSHVTSRALQQPRRRVVPLHPSKRWTHEPHARTCPERVVPRDALRTRRCLAANTPHAGGGRRSCTSGAPETRPTDVTRARRASREHRRRRSAPRGGR